MFQDNRPQIDGKDFRSRALGDVRTDNVDVGGFGAGGDAADAPQQVEHRFLAAIRHGALQALDLAEEVNLLAAIFGNLDLNRAFLDSGDPCHLLTDFGGGLAFHSQPAQWTEVDAAVRVDAALAGKIGPVLHGKDQHIRAADPVVLEDFLFVGRHGLAVEQGAIEGRLVCGTTGSQQPKSRA